VVGSGGPEAGGPTRGADLVEELHVGLVVVGPLVREVVLVVDRLDGADRFAGAAVDAFVRVDVEGAIAFVDAVDGALVDARLVLHVHTRLGDDVGHYFPLPHDSGHAPVPENPSLSPRIGTL
jgi:hypothetical protein